MRSTLVASFFLSLAIAMVGPARAAHFRLAMPSPDDGYIIDIFRLALEAEGGGHTFEVVERVLLAQDRALRALNDHEARYDVHYSGYDPKREHSYAMVRFPITRGMLGHRMLAIRADNQEMLMHISSLDALRSLRLGSGIDWPDTKIMRAAGLEVVTASDSTLWPMLARNRFDAFPRGINEIAAELKSEGSGKYGVELVAGQGVMLVYRYDHFFYLARHKRDLADIIERGLIKAHETGDLDRVIENADGISDMLSEIAKRHWQVIHLDNPLLSPAVQAMPDAYWRTYTDKKHHNR